MLQKTSNTLAISKVQLTQNPWISCFSNSEVFWYTFAERGSASKSKKKTAIETQRIEMEKLHPQLMDMSGCQKFRKNASKTLDIIPVVR